MAKKPTYSELLKKIDALEKKCARYASVDSQYRSAESVYRTFFENSGAATIIVEDNGIVSFANKQFENLYQAKKTEIEGKIKWTNFVHEDDLDFMKHYHILRRIDSSAVPDHYEFRMINKSNQLRYIVNYESLVPNTKKSIASLVDITERKIAENSLNESEAKYRALFESASDAIILMDRERMIDCNQKTLEIFGCTREKLLASKTEKFWPEFQPDGRHTSDYLTEYFQSALNGETPTFELKRLRYDGSEFEAEMTYTIVTLSGKRYLQVIIRDISERKKTEKALIEEEEKYRTLFESAIDTIIIIDNETIADCNLAALNMFRITREQLIGQKTWKFMPELQPDGLKSRETAKEKTRQAIKGETLFLEWRFIRYDSSAFDAELTFNTIILKGQKYFQAIIRDITERKQAARQMKILTEELKRSNTDLAQFAYVASHDLQEPLRMITSFVQLLQRRYHGKLDKEADEFISFAVEGASHMQKLINDLLKYSRVGTHGKSMEPTNFNIVVTHALSNLSKTIKAADAIINIDHLPTIYADYTQMVQLFQNLISNAIKYRGEKQPEVLIRATYSDNYWLFSVRDNGIGIEPEHVDKIFVIFQRLHNKTKYPGTGIGLSICKKIVERHSGSIWVESKPKQGSVFYFTIPKEQRET
ncbi:MAG TPA: PAS domain S-box protein [Deltaproteobacteria bacterium]|nr:PAS domain S-box protein [Deltaproteobacteria bacterium]